VNIRAVTLCVLALAASPAAAQPWGPYGPRAYAPAVSPYTLQATLRAHGLRPITQPVLSGYYLVVRAVDGYGDVVRVLVNARYGNVVSITPLPPAPVLGGRYQSYEAYRPYQPYPRYGAVRPDSKTEPTPPIDAAPGSVVIPNAREPVAATTVRPPMPRPRPAAATGTAAVNAAPQSGPAAPESTKSAAPDSVNVAASPATTGSVPSRSGTSVFPPAATLE
jgi:hypothetical protein